GGGCLIDIAVHSLDLAMWVTNLWNPTKASAKTYSKFGLPMKDYHYVSMWAGPPKYDGTFNVDDYATGMVRFGNQATMVFEVAWAANAQPENYVEILGTKGGVKLAGADTVLLTEFDNRLADIKLDYEKKNDGFAVELTKFVAAINGEGQIPATGDQGVIVMRLLDAIYKSCANNQEVDV
ncbi:MAG: Gfo/Idh/MocA family oxidoreductase, partial [Lentisphaerae bacterium]|nr:Gfo/Idh/MocA family oxidoreductase [Lentisphaerota bacterium]